MLSKAGLVFKMDEEAGLEENVDRSAVCLARK